jgi:hypothetical protein
MDWHWKTFWREKRFRRLVLAVFISFLLHLLLIGELKISLPSWQQDTPSLEARLVTIPAKLPTADEHQPASKALSKKMVKPPPEKPVPAIPEDIPETVDTPLEPAETAPAEATPENAASAITTPSSVLPPEEPALTLPTDDAEPIVNADAYKYVETEFDVRTDPNAKVDSRPEGRATIVYQQMPNGEQYKLESLIEPIGLAAFVIPDLVQTSDGFISGMGLQPVNYLYQFGNKQDKTYRAKMDWESAKLHLQTSKGSKEVPLTEGTQDLLSFMYQFMFIPPPQNMQLNITNGKKLDSYQYFFAGEETIETKMGELRTVLIYRDNDVIYERSELWLSFDYKYVPVKIRKTEPENKVYELLATRIKTEQPAQIKP